MSFRMKPLPIVFISTRVKLSLCSLLEAANLTTCRLRLAALQVPRQQRQELHLASCPGGADHVARTQLGNLYPGAGGIWNRPGRYLLTKILIKTLRDRKKKRRSDVGTFQPTSFEVEWDLFTLSFPSLLESIHQRSDRRGGRWVAANSLTQTLKGLGLLKKTPLKLNPSVGSVSSSFMRKCDSENLLAESAVVALHWTQAVVYLFFSCFSFKEICLLTPCGRNQ